MIVVIRMPNGEEDTLLINSDSYIDDIRRYIAEKNNWKQESIYLCTNLRLLKNSQTIRSITSQNIVTLDVVHQCSQFSYYNPENYEVKVDISEQFSIFQKIQATKIHENFLSTFDSSPELFIPVNSLYYIYGEINNHKIEALVDTGAQISIMSLKLAQKLSIEFLIDVNMIVNYTGIDGKNQAHGVINSVKMKVGNQIDRVRLVIIKHRDDYCILGLDWIKRNHAVLDFNQEIITLRNKEKIKLHTHE
ncbi:Clan AA, family A2, retrotansposon aspartic peptidase [Tritrichomonas foetus]|uniref:Clan AA, family A2, retrotansposon aspartic peptidase n=1 Tax=Tritrichomonas foetus TaxID=1144522 RepID=A0A1J4JWW5_9EUKA|nr:Clan AA, family A2, retrotansposon aspartic peptidase [Tritrichomonas foetus]|eukprot:OHT03641.1 Clan AA, family A2, retrotansposon aspartic peptidase [Tritrichomonas foetus]